jgi:hypothetical protein
MEELGDEDHDGKDEDDEEELDEAAAMTSTGGGDELNEGRGRVRGMTMTTGTREELDGEDGSAPTSACCWARARSRPPFARPRPRMEMV